MSGNDAIQKDEQKKVKEQGTSNQEVAVNEKKETTSDTPTPIPDKTPQESKEGDAEKKKRKRERNKLNRKMKEASKGAGEVAEA